MRQTIAITLSILLWMSSGCGPGDTVQQSAEEQFRLGEDYALGRGVRKNHRQALDWYRKAAEQGHATARVRLAMSYESGQGVKKDPAEALRLYQLAAVQGQPKAQLELGLAYRDGRGVPQDLVQAQAWLILSANFGSRVARFMYKNLRRQLTEEQQENARNIAHEWRAAHFSALADGADDFRGG